jgi:putative glutamine amidotransferase
MTSPRPRIGINCDSFDSPETRIFGVREPYWRAVLDAGATPVLIPFLESSEQVAAILDSLDGVVLTGGDDFRAERLGRPLHPAAVPVIPERDRGDFLLIEAILARRTPTLAICLGMQELNVHLGGTVYQDLPAERPGAVLHMGAADAGRFVPHDLQVDPGTLLSEIWNGATSATVNSAHHQAIRDLAGGLKAVAWAADWLIEAVELPAHPFCLGVQWHPERMPDDPRQRALFAALTRAAGMREV